MILIIYFIQFVNLYFRVIITEELLTFKQKGKITTTLEINLFVTLFVT